MNYKKVSITVLLCCFWALNSSADDKGKSQTAASYLWLGPSARVAGMGNSFTGLADDVSAMFYNPAGTSQFTNNQMMLSSSLLGIDRAYNVFGYVFTFEKKLKEGNYYFEDEDWGTGKRMFKRPEYRVVGVGIGLINFGVGDIESRDIFGNKKSNFSDTENTLFVNCSLNIFEGLYWGINLKVHDQNIGDSSAMGFGLDTAVLLRNPQNNFSAGLCIQNIASSLNWNINNEILKKTDIYSEPIDMRVRLGSTVQTNSKNLTISADIEYVQKQSIAWHIGTESRFFDTVLLRFGMDTLNPTFGIGFNITKKSFGLSIDYAFIFDTEKLSNQHRFGLILK